MEKSTLKNMIDNTALIVPADTGACGHYRLLQQAEMLMMAGKTVTISSPGRFHGVRQTSTWTQRICTEKMLNSVWKFKEVTGSKIVIDYDDLIWKYRGESIPDYNWTKSRIDLDGNSKAMRDLLQYVADDVTVSTDTLKKSISDFYPSDHIHVIPNMLTYREWGFKPRAYPRERTFYFAGSETHFSNEKKLTGDFSENLARYLQNQKVITKHVVPWFLNPIKSYKACPLNRYAREFYDETKDAKFIIAPLADNLFNRCKSHLKYLESCAVGRVCLVSSFEGGPYEGAHEYQKIPVDATQKTIEFIVERAEANYVEILKHQYWYLNHFWLDNNLKQIGDILGVSDQNNIS